MKNKILTYAILKAFLALLLASILLGSCSKGVGETLKNDGCMAVTLTFKETGDIIAHWHKVCENELAAFRAMPPEFPVHPICDLRVQKLVIGRDLCK